MSEEQEMPNSQLLLKFVEQRNAFVAQSEQLAMQFQQMQGAIFACNEMIKKIEQDSLEKITKNISRNSATQDNQGENVDGQVNDE